MGHASLSHRRTHNILLISRLLNQREGVSPFTLVLDTLEQPAKPLIREYVRRANLSKNRTIFLGFETPHAPAGIDKFIACWKKSPQQIAEAVASTLINLNKRCLLLIDSLTSLSKLATQPKSGFNLAAFLSSLIQSPRQSPQTSISTVAVYHTDIPLHNSATPYSPNPLSLLSYLATTMITVHSLPIMLAEKQARERSLGEPSFGLGEEKEGLMIGLKHSSKSNTADERGIVLELEHRRKSGRGVLEWYFLPGNPPAKVQSAMPAAFREIVSLFDDHPLFRRAVEEAESTDQDLAGVTFELGLTDRQRLERDGVVLPYFDAQRAGGGSEGGRILYDMGAEDDFDEEEDEI